MRYAAVVTFDEYSFDLRRGQLAHRGVPVHLEPRVSQFIGHVIGEAGHVVPRDELRARLWPDREGSDDALNYLASGARRAPSRCQSCPIATIRGRGYRFEAPLERVDPEPEQRPLYDRSSELQELRGLTAGCVTATSTRFAMVSGVAGIGKTRLVEQISREWTSGGSWGEE